VAEADDLTARLENIRRLTNDLLRGQVNTREARQLAERIKRELDLAREALKLVQGPE
jgi:hypothetical protein